MKFTSSEQEVWDSEGLNYRESTVVLSVWPLFGPWGGGRGAMHLHTSSNVLSSVYTYTPEILLVFICVLMIGLTIPSFIFITLLFI